MQVLKEIHRDPNIPINHFIFQKLCAHYQSFQMLVFGPQYGQIIYQQYLEILWDMSGEAPSGS